METLVTALAQYLRLALRSNSSWSSSIRSSSRSSFPEDYKKAILGALSLVAGLALAFGAGLRVLELLGVSSPWYWDELTTGLIISGGTQGINSILKFLGYAKEGKKADAVAKLTPVKNRVKSFADRV